MLEIILSPYVILLRQGFVLENISWQIFVNQSIDGEEGLGG